MAFDTNDLTPNEQFVIERTRAGETADLAPSAGPDGARAVVRAGFLRRLLLQVEPAWTVRAPGVRLRGARIEGKLDLTDCSGAGGQGLPALVLLDCEFDDAIDISHGRLARLSLAGGKLSRLSADEAQIGGELDLSRVSPGGGRDALVLHGRGLRIDGDFVAEGAKFVRDEDNAAALNLTNAEINGGMNLEGCRITGVVVLQGAKIGRNMDFRGVEAAARAVPRGEIQGRILDAASVAVGGAALFNGANIKGEILLADARIEGYLAFGGGRFINAGAWAIRAPNARIGGNLTFKLAESGYAPLGQKTVIEGGAKFDRAHVDGALSWAALELRGTGPDNAKGGVLSFADARIGGPLQAANLTAQEGALVDASGAACAALDDDLKTGWAADGVRLDLEGFDYGRLERPEKWRQRLQWLRRSRRDGQRFSPQPYAHLAQVFARAGRREDARRIMLEQLDQRTLRASSGPLAWVLSSAFGLIAGYGLAPIRIVRALALFLALGVAGALTMDAQGALVRPDGTACNGAIEPALYAVDVALPVIELGQETRCGPGRTARAELTPGVEVQGTGGWRLPEGTALWTWAHAFYSVLGAILTALAVLTFSGVMKPKDD